MSDQKKGLFLLIKICLIWAFLIFQGAIFTSCDSRFTQCDLKTKEGLLLQTCNYFVLFYCANPFFFFFLVKAANRSCRHTFHSHSAAPALFSLPTRCWFPPLPPPSVDLPEISHNYSRPRLSSTPPYSNPYDPSSSTAVLPWKPLRRGER